LSISSKEQGLCYVLRGKNRREIYQLLLTGPRTQGELSKKTGIALSNVCRAIKQLEQQKLVKNLTPSEPKGCLFGLTDLAIDLKTEFKYHLQF